MCSYFVSPRNREVMNEKPSPSLSAGIFEVEAIIATKKQTPTVVSDLFVFPCVHVPNSHVSILSCFHTAILPFVYRYSGSGRRMTVPGNRTAVWTTEISRYIFIHVYMYIHYHYE